MKYINVETYVNLFGKPKRFIDIVTSKPISAELIYNSILRDGVFDTELSRRITYFFPEGTDRIIDRIMAENLRRINERNRIKGESLECDRRYLTSQIDGRINYATHNHGVITVKRTSRISRPVDRLNELFKS